MPAFFDTGFSVRQPMWHGEGEVLDDYPDDWAAARVAAGLDWEPELRPMVEVRCADEDCGVVLTAGDLEVGACGSCLATGHRVVVVPDEARVTRSDTGFHLGSVSDKFSPVTHRQMGEVLEALADSDSAVRFETAGSVRDGRQVWALAYLDEPVQVAGDDSATLPFLALLNSHDGTGAMKVLPTSVRVVCWNTYRAAEMQGERHGHQFVFRHRGNVAERIEEAKSAIRGVRSAHLEWVELATELAKHPVSDEVTRNFVAAMLPMPAEDALTSERVKTDVTKARSALNTILTVEPTCDGHRGTVLGLVDGAVEYLDHVRAFRSRDTLMNRTLLRPEPMKSRVVAVAREVAGV